MPQSPHPHSPALTPRHGQAPPRRVETRGNSPGSIPGSSAGQGETVRGVLHPPHNGHHLCMCFIHIESFTHLIDVDIDDQGGQGLQDLQPNHLSPHGRTPEPEVTRHLAQAAKHLAGLVGKIGHKCDQIYLEARRPPPLLGCGPSAARRKPGTPCSSRGRSPWPPRPPAPPTEGPVLVPPTGGLRVQSRCRLRPAPALPRPT